MATLRSVATQSGQPTTTHSRRQTPGRRPGKEHPTMSTSLEAQQLTTLLRLSSELDIVGDVTATVATPSELLAWAHALPEPTLVRLARRGLRQPLCPGHRRLPPQPRPRPGHRRAHRRRPPPVLDRPVRQTAIYSPARKDSFRSSALTTAWSATSPSPSTVHRTGREPGH